MGIATMKDELEYLKIDHLWDLVDLSLGRKTIGNKWAVKIKRKAYGSALSNEARLAEGYALLARVDYEKTFSPVVRFASFHLNLALELFQMVGIIYCNLALHELNNFVIESSKFPC